jgi:hypothetical protein
VETRWSGDPRSLRRVVSLVAWHGYRIDRMSSELEQRDGRSNQYVSVRGDRTEVVSTPLFALVVVLSLSFACTSEGPDGPGTSTPLRPSDSPSAAEVILPFEGEGAPLEPGPYAYDAFSGPPMSFAVGEGWVGGHTNPEFFDVQREGVLLGFAYPTFVVGADGAVDVDELSAEDALRTIATNPPFAGGTVRSATIDDRPAFQVGGSPETSVELFGGNEGSFTVEPGSVRLLAVEVDGDLVLIVASITSGQPDSVNVPVNEVISSVRFQ